MNIKILPTVNYDGWYFFYAKSETEWRILYIEETRLEVDYYKREYKQ